MIQTTLHVLFYALIAAASPLALAATLVVIRHERPRTNGIAFLTGFLVGSVLATALALAVGTAAEANIDSHQTVATVLALLLGLALIVAGFKERNKPQPAPDAQPGGGQILQRLAGVGPVTASTIAGFLGFGGPKRLVLTFLAMSLVTAANVGDVDRVVLPVVFVVVASLVVSMPIGYVIVGGNRAFPRLHRLEHWLTSHSEVLRVRLALGLGAILVADSVIRLVG